MRPLHGRRLLIGLLIACFGVVVGAEAFSGHVAIALGFIGLGIFAAAVHGTATTSRARPLLIALSASFSALAIGLMLAALRV